MSSCDRFEIEGTKKFDVQAWLDEETDITDIRTGKLFYRERSGACVPTTDTYLVVVMNGDFPRIVAVLDGHTVKLRAISTDDSVYLAAYYFSGGNQYLLSIFNIATNDLRQLPGPGLASNIRSIEVNGSRITVENQVPGQGGVRKIVKREYKIDNGRIVASM